MIPRSSAIPAKAATTNDVRNRKEKIAFVKGASEVKARNIQVKSEERQESSGAENILDQIGRVSPDDDELAVGHVDNHPSSRR